MSEDGSSVGLVEEILEQQSAHALKLSHIDEAVGEVKLGLADLKLNLQRLADITSITANNMPRETTNSGHGHAIDALEKEAHAAKSRMSLMLAVMGLQTLLLVALLIFAFKPLAQPSSSASAPAPTPAVVEAPKPAAAPPATAAPSLVDPFKGATGEAKEEEKPVEKEKPGKKKKKK